jgi:radical SAM superfamily enzyme YgiQ (UPF0313 family)
MDSDSLQFHLAIVRLSPFRDVAKSITHQFLYGECRTVLDDNCIDFVFFPTEAERKRRTELCGIRTQRPLSEFDLILVSNSFTTELLNLPALLTMAHLPCRSDERSKVCSKPLIIMGGSNALAAQSILYDDETAMVDALFFGEGELLIRKIVSAISAAPQDRRRSVLASLQGTIPGLKVFGAGDAVIEKARYMETQTEQLAHAEQYLFDSSEAATARLFIAYDCPASCTFCFEGWERKPYREVPLLQLLEAAENLRLKTGADTLEITAFNFNTHTDVTALIRELSKRFFQVNFMSQRADILAANPTLAHYEVSSGKRQYTIGVEGISERIRSYFNKNLNEETALRALTLLLKEPVREIKLFYIISGLETQADTDDFKNFLAKVGELREQYNSGIRILCSFGLLVRMPFTPLRYERLLLNEEDWKPVVEMIRRTTESAGYEFRLTYPYEEYFLSQTLALTNKKCAAVLEEMAVKGFVYDQGLPSGAWDFFKSRVPPDASFISEKDDQYQFAFNYVDTKTAPSVYYDRYCLAKKCIETPLCLGIPCNGCGSCSSQQRTALTSHHISMPTIQDCERIASLVKAKAQARPVYISTYIPENYRGAREETKAAAVQRELLSRIPHSIELIMTARDVLFDGKQFEGKLPRWYGKTLFAVYPFSNEQRPELIKALLQNGYQVTSQEPVVKEIYVELTAKTITDTKEFEKIAGRLLDTMHMQYTLSRQNGISIFCIAPKALKKHVVSACKLQEGKLSMTTSEKLDLSILKRDEFTAVMNYHLQGIKNDEFEISDRTST